MRRAAPSRSLVLVDVFVADDQAIMPQGSYYLAATEWPHMFMTLCPSYLGLAGAAFDFTVRYLRGEVEGGPPATRRSVSKQLAVGQLRIKLEQASALFERAVGEAGYQPSALERARALAAHYTVMEHSQEICALAIRTCGGRAIQKAFPLERWYRDSRSGSLMLPWSAEIVLERLGRSSLYQPGETD